MTKRFVSLLLVLAIVLLPACGKASKAWQEQYDLGVKYLTEGNYKEAILAFTAAIELDPKQPDAYVGRADAYMGSAELLASGSNASDPAVREQIQRCYECAEADYAEAVKLVEDGKKAELNLDVLKSRLEDAAAKQMEIPPEDQIPAYDPEAEAEQTPAEEEATEEEVPEEEPVEETPVVPQADPAEVDEAIGLYASLLQNNLTPLSWNNEYYEMTAGDLIGTEPTAIEGVWGYPYGINAMLLTDLNDDGLPELMLQAGEVEQELYIFTVRDGKIHCTGHGWLDNQNGTCVLSLYTNAEGRTVAVSDGGAGTGAGNAYFMYYTNPEDLSMRQTDFRAYDDFDGTNFVKVYKNGDQDITEEEYNALRSEFYTQMTPKAILQFLPIGPQPADILRTLVTEWQASLSN